MLLLVQGWQVLPWPKELPPSSMKSLAERRFRRAKHVAEGAQRKDFIRGFHQNPRHGGKSLVAADAVHGQSSYPITGNFPNVREFMLYYNSGFPIRPALISLFYRFRHVLS